MSTNVSKTDSLISGDHFYIHSSRNDDPRLVPSAVVVDFLESSTELPILLAANIAALREFSDSSISDGGAIKVLGYYTTGDGGGGSFYWDSTSTETDNGGTIVKSTNITTGRWKRILDGSVVNANYFGIMDGLSDNSASFVSAMQSLESGQTLYFPKGLYNLASSILVSEGHEIQNDNISIIGSGATGSKLKITGITPAPLFFSENKSNILIQDLEIEGNLSSTGFSKADTAIWWEHDDLAVKETSGLTVRNVTLSNFMGPSWITAYNAATSQGFLQENVIIENVTCFGGDDRNPSSVGVAARQIGSFSTLGGKIDNISINNCKLNASEIKSGIFFQGTHGRCIVKSCVVEDCGTTDAIDETGRYAFSDYGSCELLVFEDCEAISPHSCGIYSVNTENLTIRNFKCNGTRDGQATTLPKGAIALNGTDGVYIYGGLIDDCILGIDWVPPSTQTLPSIIDGVAFIGNATYPSTLKLRTEQASDYYGGIIKNCTFNDALLNLRSSPAVWYELKIINNDFKNTLGNTIFFTTEGSENRKFQNIRIEKNRFESSTVVPTRILQGEFEEGCWIVDNEFYGDVSGVQVYLYQCDRVKVTGNRHKGVVTGDCYDLVSAQGIFANNEFEGIATSEVGYAVGGFDELGNAEPVFNGYFPGHEVHDYNGIDRRRWNGTIWVSL